MRLHTRHFRAAGICGAGVLAYRRRYRDQVRQLVREGIPIDALGELREDPFVQRAIAAAIAEEAAHAPA